MLDAAVRALTQMLSPPFRAILLKSVGLALVLIFVIGFALHRLLVKWEVTPGEKTKDQIFAEILSFIGRHEETSHGRCNVWLATYFFSGGTSRMEAGREGFWFHLSLDIYCRRQHPSPYR